MARWLGWLPRRSQTPWLALLIGVCVVSFAARAAWLGAPCHTPCRNASARVLIFDERYYVNAARTIAGLRPLPGSPYAYSPRGVDPNAEHPQLVKLLIAGAIELFGDGPLAWRLGSLIAGTLSIIGMFALVRAAGGGRRPALAAAALMAADNLIVVHGRIATLDVFALTAMVWGAALYLRGRPLLAGAVIGVGLSGKLVVAYVLIVLLLCELLQRFSLRSRGIAWCGRLAGCWITAAGIFIALLALFDRIAPPYDYTTGRHVRGGVIGHLAHMITYAAGQTSPHGPRGIASYPWGWLVDYKPIVYLNIDPARPVPGLNQIYPAVHFLGLISPPILLLAVPALGMAMWTIVRRRGGPDVELAVLAVAWFLGAFLPFVVLSLIFSRTSYLYYMVIVMPGLYAAVGWLLPRVRRWPRLTVLWAVGVVVAAVVTYPLTPLP